MSAISGAVATRWRITRRFHAEFSMRRWRVPPAAMLSLMRLLRDPARLLFSVLTYFAATTAKDDVVRACSLYRYGARLRKTRGSA